MIPRGRCTCPSRNSPMRGDKYLNPEGGKKKKRKTGSVQTTIPHPGPGAKVQYVAIIRYLALGPLPQSPSLIVAINQPTIPAIG